MPGKIQKKLPSDELEYILNNHHRWLESKGTDGDRADLRYCDLSNRNLSGVDLRMAILRNINFSRANLRTANLKQTDLHGCRFHQAHMQWSILAGAELHNNDLTQANLQFCDLSDTAMSDNHFAGAFFLASTLATAAAISRRFLLTDRGVQSLARTSSSMAPRTRIPA